jgi:hypothetical protein
MSLHGYLGDQIGRHKKHVHKLKLASDLNGLGELESVGVVCKECEEIVLVLGGPKANLYDGELYKLDQIGPCLLHFDDVALRYYGREEDRDTKPWSVTIECDRCSCVIANLYDVAVECHDEMDGINA